MLTLPFRSLKLGRIGGDSEISRGTWCMYSASTWTHCLYKIKKIQKVPETGWTLFICFPPPGPLNSKIWSVRAPNILATFYTATHRGPQDSKMDSSGLKDTQIETNLLILVDFIEKFCLSTARVHVAFPQIVQKSLGVLSACTRLGVNMDQISLSLSLALSLSLSLLSLSLKLKV